MLTKTRRIWVCINGPHCCQLNPDKVLDALNQAAVEQQAGDKIEIVGAGCLGMCGDGPNALVMLGRTRIKYSHLKPEDAAVIVAAHAEGDTPVEHLRNSPPKVK